MATIVDLSTINSRQDANTVILAVLQQYLCEHPDIRFQQALMNLGLWKEIDPFYEESMTTLVDMYHSSFVVQDYIQIKGGIADDFRDK